MAKPVFGFNREKREGEDVEAVNKLFTPEFRNRLDAVIPFSGLPQEVIAKVVEKFIFQLEAQLADRGVTIELSEAALKWIGEKGYDEKFGRPSARPRHPGAHQEAARGRTSVGRLENGGTVKILVKGKGPESELTFEFLPADPSKKARPKDDEEDDDDLETEAALVEATPPRKALPGPGGAKEKKEKPTRPAGGAVPPVPRKKDE